MLRKTLAGRVEAQKRTRARLAVCRACPHLAGKPPLERCGLCGCLVAAKAQFASFSCPENRWDEAHRP